MATPPEPPRPPSPPAPPGPPRSGSNVLAIVLMALALIVVVCGLAVWVGFHYLVRSFRVHERDAAGGGKQVSISTPFGGINVDQGKGVNEAALGLPLYPGAKQVTDQGSASISLGLPDSNSVHIVVGKFESADPPDKVLAFYHNRLGSEVTKFTERNAEGKTVFEIKHNDDERVVTVKGIDDGTSIELVHVGHASGESN
ncbi:MAG TPA: hypothetical protein VKU44_09910 [Terriglobia bacterium]|nr:hypothetical protein [Terriglobia bacterium]